MAIKRANYDPATMYGASPNLVNATAAMTLDAESSGRVIVLNAAAGFAITLPTVNSGLEYTFLVKTAPTSGNYTVAGASGTLIGGFTNSAAGAGNTTTGGTTITFAQNQAVAGDKVYVVCDGTYWYINGYCKVAAGITVA